MKKLYFSLAFLWLSLNAASQTAYPCTRNFDVRNNGNGNQTCPDFYPGNSAYKKDGNIIIYFTSPLGAAVNAPNISNVRRLLSGILDNPADMKFVLRSIAADRLSAEYCFYSKNNSNLFNGNGGFYSFTIHYQGLAEQACNPISRTIPSTLPVKFSSFTVAKNGAGVAINWSTESELDNKGFDVERKMGNGEWTGLGFVASKAQSGASSDRLAYTYNDVTAPAGLVQYRLKQTDLDGSIQYSEIRTLQVEEKAAITVYPNPAAGRQFQVRVPGNEACSIQVINASGIMVKIYNNVTGVQQVDGLSSGQFLVRVCDKNGTSIGVEKVLVQ